MAGDHQRLSYWWEAIFTPYGEFIKNLRSEHDHVQDVIRLAELVTQKSNVSKDLTIK
jgi:hypothetical protein